MKQNCLQNRKSGIKFPAIYQTTDKKKKSYTCPIEFKMCMFSVIYSFLSFVNISAYSPVRSFEALYLLF